MRTPHHSLPQLLLTCAVAASVSGMATIASVTLASRAFTVAQAGPSGSGDGSRSEKSSSSRSREGQNATSRSSVSDKPFFQFSSTASSQKPDDRSGSGGDDKPWLTDEEREMQEREMREWMEKQKAEEAARQASTPIPGMGMPSTKPDMGMGITRTEEPKRPQMNDGQPVNNAEDRPLGCFDLNGDWTRERAKCAADQSRYLFPQDRNENDNRPQDPSGGGASASASGEGTVSNPLQSGPIQAMEAERQKEEHLRMQLDREFVREKELDAKREELVHITTDAVALIQNFRRTREVERPLDERMQETLGWLQDTIDVAAKDHSLSEWNDRILEVKQRLGEVAKDILAVDRAEPAAVRPAAVDADGIVRRLDNVVARVPAVFDLYTEKRIAIPDEAVATYEQARNALDEIATRCTNLKTCAQLVETVDALQHWKSAMDEAIPADAKAAVRKEVDAIFAK